MFKKNYKSQILDFIAFDKMFQLFWKWGCRMYVNVMKKAVYEPKIDVTDV